MEELVAQIKDAVVAGKHQDIETLTERSLQEGLGVDDLINNALIAAMDTVGSRFAEGEIFVPEMLVSAKTMQKALDMVKPLLQESENQSKGKVILCTVKGDMHDIGKNLVAMMLEGAGFEVIDLGVDATVETVLQKINAIQPDILGLSALLTTTMPEMKKVIEVLNSKGIRDQIKVMVGGAPLSHRFSRDIGADGFGKDAAEAVVIARRFMAQ